MVINAPAMVRLISCPASLTKFIRPTEIGRQSGVLVTSIGQAKAFQVPIKDNTTITINGAFERGNTTCNKKRRCPAPSIWAASKSSSGTCAKNCLNMKIEKMLPINGMVNDGQLLIQGMVVMRPNQVTVRKFGIVNTMAGIIIVLKSALKIKSRPGNWMRAKAYAARMLKVICPAKVIKVIKMLLTKYSVNCARRQASM